jgi:hypothetical protein
MTNGTDDCASFAEEESDDEDGEDEFVNALLDELSALRSAVRLSPSLAFLPFSHANVPRTSSSSNRR